MQRNEGTKNDQSTPTKRAIALDALRGVAILMMIAYHTLFDLCYFGSDSFSPIILSSFLVILFQRVTASLFIVIAGISIALSLHVLSTTTTKTPNRHFLNRTLFLGVVALLITVATWIYPHDWFISFGIIHLLAVSTLIIPFFFNFSDKTNLIIAATIILVGSFILPNIYVNAPFLFPIGLITPDYSALDFFPILPWFGVFLAGFVIGKKLISTNSKLVDITIIHPTNKTFQSLLAFLGRNSLIIYLIHQPLILVLLAILEIISL